MSADNTAAGLSVLVAVSVTKITFETTDEPYLDYDNHGACRFGSSVLDSVHVRCMGTKGSPVCILAVYRPTLAYG